MPELTKPCSFNPPVEDFQEADLGTLPEARHRLFFQHQDLAEAMAHKYRRLIPDYKVDGEDLQMAAYEGLLYAIDNFDPAQVEAAGPFPQGFRRYASRCIFGFLMDELTRHDPLTKYLQDQVREYRQQAERLAQFLGRTPTSQELREALGYRDEKRFQLLESLADYQVNQESLAPEPEADGVNEEAEDWNVTRAAAGSCGRDPVASNPPYAATVLALFREQLQGALATLPPLQQQVIQVYYYGEETLTQMARDIGISRQTLSQHHQRALTQLQETLTQEGYGEENLPGEWEVDVY